MKQLLLAIPLLLAQSAWAEEEHREHDSHVHGEVELNIAISGQEVSIEVLSPAYNILGFEHEAESAEDKRTLSEAVKTLSSPLSLLRPDREAICILEKKSVESTLLEDEHEHHEEDEHDHGHEKEHAKEHDDHDHDKEHADEHDHDKEHEHDEEKAHSNVNLHVELHCDKPGRLKIVDTSELFKAFPRIEEIHVQWVSDRKQSSTKLTPKDTVISLQ